MADLHAHRQFSCPCACYAFYLKGHPLPSVYANLNTQPKCHLPCDCFPHTSQADLTTLSCVFPQLPRILYWSLTIQHHKSFFTTWSHCWPMSRIKSRIMSGIIESQVLNPKYLE